MENLEKNLAITLTFEPLPDGWLIMDIIPYLDPFAFCTVDEIIRLSTTFGRLNVITMKTYGL